MSPFVWKLMNITSSFITEYFCSLNRTKLQSLHFCFCYHDNEGRPNMDLHCTESNRKDWQISCMHNWTLAYVLHAIWKRIVELFVEDWWDGVEISEKRTQTHTCDGSKQTQKTLFHHSTLWESLRKQQDMKHSSAYFTAFPTVEIRRFSLGRRAGTGSVWLVTTRPVTLINHSIQENWFIAGRVATIHPASGRCFQKTLWCYSHH